MKTFWVRLSTLAIVAVALVGYNSVVEAREKDETLAQLEAQLAQAESGAESSGTGTAGTVSDYADGTYTGSAMGFGGDITVEVTVEGGAITDITIASAPNEDAAYLTMAQDIIPAILKAQSTEVDTISGATFSSTGIKDAVALALSEAE